MEGSTALVHMMPRTLPIMLQKFKREIGVVIFHGQAKHKMSRIHYVRVTAGEVKVTARANHSKKRFRLGHD